MLQLKKELPAFSLKDNRIVACDRKNKTTEHSVNRLFFITVGLIAIVTFAVYWQVHSFDFVSLDDNMYVTKNPNTQSGLTVDSIKWAFTTRFNANWHPLTWLSLMLDYELYGLNAGGFHITNLIFHLANTVLLFWLFLRMTKAFWPSAFVAALFALHPLHVESVVWIAERKDVLSTFFWFLTMLAYIRYTENKTKSRYAAVIIFFALGLMAKPMLVTLPFVLLLVDYWPLERLSKSAVLEKLPLFAISACSSIVTFFAQKTGGAVASTQMIPINFRIENAIISYIQYLNKTLWPAKLAFFYPYPRNHPPISQVVFAALTIIVLSVLVIRSRRQKVFTFGWLWFLGTLVPVIGIVQVGDQAMADRYMYVPMIGLSIIIAWEMQRLSLKVRLKRLIKILAMIVIATLALLTWRQISLWQNWDTFYQHSLAVTKNNYVMHSCFGVELLRHGKNDEAIRHFQEAIKIRPSFAGAYNNLGVAYKRKGDLEQAIRCFREAIKANPYYADAYMMLANTLVLQGEKDEAFENYKKVLQIDDNAEVHFLLGKLLAKERKVKQALTHINRAIQINPNLIGVRAIGDKLFAIMKQAGSYYEQAKTFEKQGNIVEAVKSYRQAVDLVGDLPAVLNNLAWLLATNSKVRNPADAVRFAEQAAELTEHNQAGILDTLAAAYAATGDFAKAVETAQKAVDLAKSTNKQQLAENITVRLELYKKGVAYVESSK